jgi:hypothetical protein
MLSPPGSASAFKPTPNVTVNGNSYSGALIAAVSSDVTALQAAGYVVINLSGPTTASIGPTYSSTSSRPLPTNAGAGAVYLDETLGALLASDGLAWRYVATGVLA